MLRNREGFTLIELLIVVVIIGILAAIALPKFGQTRERAYRSAMQSDLRNFQTAAEMYYNDHYEYATGIGAAANQVNFKFTSGVVLPPTYTLSADATPGYTLRLYHDGLGGTAGEYCQLVVDQDPTVVEGITCVAP